MPLLLFWVFVRPFFALGAQSCRRASRRFIPPRAVSGFCPPAIPAPSRVLRLSNTSVWGSWARGVAWLHVHAHRDVLAQPLFSWPPKGRALMAVTWHDHLLPCACGMAHALDQGSGAACASGLGRSSSRRGCSRAGAPPSAPLLMSGFWSALCALALLVYSASPFLRVHQEVVCTYT